MRIAICDDNIEELNRAHSAVYCFFCTEENAEKVTIDTFTNAQTLLSAFTSQGRYDLVMLDIIMPEINGFDLAGKVRKIDADCKIVFLTSSRDFAIDSYKYDAYYYLLKDHLDSDLPLLINKLKKEVSAQKTQSIMIKNQGQLHSIYLDDICYVESMNHKVYFHFANREPISTYLSLTTFSETLLANPDFIKCHKSFIVNIKCVTGIKGCDFVLKNGSIIPISRNLFSRTKDTYLDYFFKEEGE